MHASLQCQPMDYQPGDEILISAYNPTTLRNCGIGSFLIAQVHTNRSIKI